ncbi:hypothetical protein HYV86_01535 [Candidatus Woesearchaeota archaeon]|nr:hypothetical protein [Candidatus Woesearchaeota archaeon]
MAYENIYGNCGMMGGFGYGGGWGWFFMILTALILIGLSIAVFIWLTKLLRERQENTIPVKHQEQHLKPKKK